MFPDPNAGALNKTIALGLLPGVCSKASDNSCAGEHQQRNSAFGDKKLVGTQELTHQEGLNPGCFYFFFFFNTRSQED